VGWRSRQRAPTLPQRTERTACGSHACAAQRSTLIIKSRPRETRGRGGGQHAHSAHHRARGAGRAQHGALQGHLIRCRAALKTTPAPQTRSAGHSRRHANDKGSHDDSTDDGSGARHWRATSTAQAHAQQEMHAERNSGRQQPAQRAELAARPCHQPAAHFRPLPEARDAHHGSA
jgi:hypothetical protein